MKDRMFRSLALAALATFSLGIAAYADGCLPQCAPRRACRKPAPAVHYTYKRVIEKPELIKENKDTVTKITETPIEVPAQPAPVIQQVVAEPAVIPAESPVVIRRFVRHHRSLIHLGLFPHNLD